MAEDKKVDIMSRVRRVGQAVQDLRLKQKRFVLNTAIQALDLEEEDEAIRAAKGTEDELIVGTIETTDEVASSAPARRGSKRYNGAPAEEAAATN